MIKRYLVISGLIGLLIAAMLLKAQEPQSNTPVVHVDVNLVLLNVAVTDNKGHYVTGLKPSDFTVVEDNIPQKLATFGEGDAPQRPVDPTLDSNLVGSAP